MTERCPIERDSRKHFVYRCCWATSSNSRHLYCYCLPWSVVHAAPVKPIVFFFGIVELLLSSADSKRVQAVIVRNNRIVSLLIVGLPTKLEATRSGCILSIFTHESIIHKTPTIKYVLNGIVWSHKHSCESLSCTHMHSVRQNCHWRFLIGRDWNLGCFWATLGQSIMGAPSRGILAGISLSLIVVV